LTWGRKASACTLATGPAAVGLRVTGSALQPSRRRQGSRIPRHQSAGRRAIRNQVTQLSADRLLGPSACHSFVAAKVSAKRNLLGSSQRGRDRVDTLRRNVTLYKDQRSFATASSRAWLIDSPSMMTAPPSRNVSHHSVISVPPRCSEGPGQPIRLKAGVFAENLCDPTHDC
jgi:hypothetical protein